MIYIYIYLVLCFGFLKTNSPFYLCFMLKELARVRSCNVTSCTQYSITTDMLLAPFNNVQIPLREEPQITTTKLIVQIAQDGNTQTLTKFKLRMIFLQIELHYWKHSGQNKAYKHTGHTNTNVTNSSRHFYLHEQQKQHATPNLSNKEREICQPIFNMIDIELIQVKWNLPCMLSLYPQHSRTTYLNLNLNNIITSISVFIKS